MSHILQAYLVISHSFKYLKKEEQKHVWNTNLKMLFFKIDSLDLNKIK